MAAGGILGLGFFRQTAIGALHRFALGRNGAALDVCKAEPVHVGNPESPRMVDISDGIGSLVAELRGVRQCADACAVQHDQDYTFFQTDHLMD